MNSDFIDLDTEFVNLDASKNLEDGATYRLAMHRVSGRRTRTFSRISARPRMLLFRTVSRLIGRKLQNRP